MEAFIAFGSNLGDSKKLIEQAIEELKKNKIQILKKSTVIETEPYGNLNQPSFLNGVLKVETDLDPFELLKVLNSIEFKLGRVRKEHWGARTIDLDIIFYEDEIINTENLIIPHYDMENRTFVLEPMVEIEKDFVHPKLKKTMLELLNELINK